MQEIPLIANSRQSLSILLDGNRWDIRLYEVLPDGLMGADFALGGVDLITGVRCVANKPLVPYNYLQALGSGNFAFTTLNNMLPWWEQFGTTNCRLIYASAAELPA